MFDHNTLIMLLVAPVVAYIAGAILFSIIVALQENVATSSSLNSSTLNRGHSL